MLLRLGVAAVLKVYAIIFIVAIAVHTIKQGDQPLDFVFNRLSEKTLIIGGNIAPFMRSHVVHSRFRTGLSQPAASVVPQKDANHRGRRDSREVETCRETGMCFLRVTPLDSGTTPGHK
jgi:hypothetical protein